MELENAHSDTESAVLQDNLLCAVDQHNNLTYQCQSFGVLQLSVWVIPLKLGEEHPPLPHPVLWLVFVLLDLDPPHDCITSTPIKNGVISIAYRIKLPGYAHEPFAELFQP
jgi:hypothetical protein